MDRMLRVIARMVCGKDMTVALEATGFSSSSAFRYFVKRLKEMSAAYACSLTRRFSKASFAEDISTKMVLACDCIDSCHSDVKRMAFIIDDLAEGGFSIRCVVADKRYDAEYVHRNVHD